MLPLVVLCASIAAQPVKIQAVEVCYLHSWVVKYTDLAYLDPATQTVVSIPVAPGCIVTQNNKPSTFPKLVVGQLMVLTIVGGVVVEIQGFIDPKRP